MRRCLVGLLAAAGALAGCGSSQVAYQPAAWGPAGQCYYLYSPYECFGHHYGVPVLMPVFWHERYAGFYDSPAYRSVYVPRAYRPLALARSRVFERTYAGQIRSAGRAASWKGSNGRVVSGSKVGRSAVFGSGGARSSGFSGGSLRRSSSGSPCGAVHERSSYRLVSFLIARGGGSSGGGSHGSISSGGSARSGQSGSRSGSRGGRNC